MILKQQSKRQLLVVVISLVHGGIGTATTLALATGRRIFEAVLAAGAPEAAAIRWTVASYNVQEGLGCGRFVRHDGTHLLLLHNPAPLPCLSHTAIFSFPLPHLQIDSHAVVLRRNGCRRKALRLNLGLPACKFLAVSLVPRAIELLSPPSVEYWHQGILTSLHNAIRSSTIEYWGLLPKVWAVDEFLKSGTLAN